MGVTPKRCTAIMTCCIVSLDDDDLVSVGASHLGADSCACEHGLVPCACGIAPRAFVGRVVADRGCRRQPCSAFFASGQSLTEDLETQPSNDCDRVLPSSAMLKAGTSSSKRDLPKDTSTESLILPPTQSRCNRHGGPRRRIPCTPKTLNPCGEGKLRLVTEFCKRTG